MAARGPPAHHGVGHVGMELQREGGAAVTEGLHREGITLRQQVRAERQVEALAMPLVNLLRPGIAHRAADLSRPDRVVANLSVAVGMTIDPAAEMVRQHLRAEADAEKWLILFERHAQPIDLAADEIVGIVRAHGAAEDDGAGVARHGLGQQIAQTRPAHVERIAALTQGITDASGRRGLLMQYDQKRREHRAIMASKAFESQYRLESDFQDALPRWLAAAQLLTVDQLEQ